MTEPTKRRASEIIGWLLISIVAVISVIVLIAQSRAETPPPPAQGVALVDKDQLTLSRIELDLVKAARVLQSKNQLCQESLAKNDPEYSAAVKLQSEAGARLNTVIARIREEHKCPGCFLDEEAKDGERHYVLRKPPEVQATKFQEQPGIRTAVPTTDSKKEAKP